MEVDGSNMESATAAFYAADGAPLARVAVPAPRRVLLPAPLRARLGAMLRAALPAEGVLLLGGRRDGHDRWLGAALPLPNRLAAADAFAVDPVDFVRALHDLPEAAPWLGFAHSHPGGTAFPSAADARSLWRGCLHLIAGLQQQQTLLAAWWHGDGGLLPLPIAPLP
jgi:proteasome lid subunit RPN8/RPN11